MTTLAAWGVIAVIVVGLVAVYCLTVYGFICFHKWGEWKVIAHGSLTRKDLTIVGFWQKQERQCSLCKRVQTIIDRQDVED